MGEPARDLEAERAWLLQLPCSPETDAMQDAWERSIDEPVTEVRSHG